MRESPQRLAQVKMKKRNPQSIKTFPESPNFKNQCSGSFFSDELLPRNSSNKREEHSVEKTRHEIIKYVKEHPNCTSWQIKKHLGLVWRSVSDALRELVFARVLCVKQGISEKNIPCELFFIPEKEGKNE